MTKTTAITVLLVALSGACSGGGPVGFVDMPRVFGESRAGKQGTADLEEQARIARKDVADVDAALKKATAAKAPEAELQGARDRLNAAVQGYNAAVKQRSEASTARLVDSAVKVATKLAGERGLTLVLPVADRPLYAHQALDLTADVIKRLDAESANSAEIAALRSEVEKLKKAAAPATPEKPGQRP